MSGKEREGSYRPNSFSFSFYSFSYSYCSDPPFLLSFTCCFLLCHFVLYCVAACRRLSAEHGRLPLLFHLNDRSVSSLSCLALSFSCLFACRPPLLLSNSRQLDSHRKRLSQLTSFKKCCVFLCCFCLVSLLVLFTFLLFEDRFIRFLLSTALDLTTISPPHFSLLFHVASLFFVCFCLSCNPLLSSLCSIHIPFPFVFPLFRFLYPLCLICWMVVSVCLSLNVCLVQACRPLPSQSEVETSLSLQNST